MKLLKYNYNGEDREVRLSERDYKILLDRFDLTKVKEEDEDFIINKPCICPYYKECKVCPFTKKIIRSRRYVACLAWVKSITKQHYIPTLYNERITWTKGYDKEAREAITKLREALLGAER